MQPIKEYELKIWGNGRLVTLEHTQFPHRGAPVLQSFYKTKEGDEMESSYTVYFYRPQPGGKLEIIR